MPTTLRGADADELERIAQTLRSAADELDGHAGSLTSTLRSVAWVGGVATRFGSQWSGGHRPRILSTARYVRDAAVQLDRNAAEQRLASRARAGGPGGTGGNGPTPPVSPPAGDPIGPPAPEAQPAGGSSSSVEPPGSEVLDRLEGVLGALGLGRDVLELIGEHAESFEGSGFDELLDVLSNDAFLAVLEGLDTVISVGDVVVDLVKDFVENPGLPFDERIVHALADAATRFGLDQGAEYAANFLAQATTAALLPGVGAALAPFVGKAAGIVAGEILGVIVDAVDGATDIVDLAADAAVEAYQALKETFGVILDAAGAVIDVADAALDLTVDAAGVVVDAGGAVVDGVVDAGGAVAGGIADAGSTVGGWLGL
jgi:hypothetical protein